MSASYLTVGTVDYAYGGLLVLLLGFFFRVDPIPQKKPAPSRVFLWNWMCCQSTVSLLVNRSTVLYCLFILQFIMIYYNAS